MSRINKCLFHHVAWVARSKVQRLFLYRVLGFVRPQSNLRRGEANDEGVVQSAQAIVETLK